jgi:HEAT repeat protein
MNFGQSPGTQEVKRLDTEVQTLRQTVALSLLERQSATSRLEGISWSSRVEHPDNDLVSALLSTLNSDPNINVRLSALDAVEKFSSDPAVRKSLVESIPRQDSPLVQIALIDAVVHMRDNTAATELRKLTGDQEVNAAVRQRAQWGLQKLTYQ